MSGSYRGIAGVVVVVAGCAADPGGAYDGCDPRCDGGSARRVVDAAVPTRDAGDTGAASAADARPPAPRDAGWDAPPRTDARADVVVEIRRDAGVDVVVEIRRDAGVDTGVDAGVAAPRPPGDVVWMAWPEQHARADARWGAALTDIVRHLPLSYGDTYADSDLVTYGHETSHGIHSHLRNNFNRTGRRANAFYCMDGRGAVVVEPGIRKSAVAAFVPASLRGSRFALYITGSSAWDDTPLYVWDEWVAYTNGSEVGVGLARAGRWTYGWRDAVAGTLEFVAYALALGMAVEAGDPEYFRTYDQFRAFLAWNARRAMELYRAGAAMPEFRWDRQDAYFRALRESPDAEALRAFARRTFGRAWASEVLGLPP